MINVPYVIPKSKGGDNELHNYQTMCSICNWKKGDTYEEEILSVVNYSIMNEIDSN